MRKLRVGLLLDNRVIPAWVYTMLKRIINSNYATIELIIFNKSNSTNGYTNARPTRLSITSRIVKRVLEYIQTKLVDNTEIIPDAFSPKNVTELLPDTQVVEVRPVRQHFSDYFTDDDINRIKKSDIDVFIRLGFRILRGKILTLPKFGVWSYHHGDNLFNRGGPAGFWEVMESWPTTGSVLQILGEDLDNGKVLFRSTSCTWNTSIRQNKNNYYWKSLSFVPRKMEELYRIGERAFFQKVERTNEHPFFYSNRLFTKPSNLQLFTLLFKKLLERIKSKLVNTLYLDQWILMFDMREDMSTSFWRFRKIIPPKDRFWADPHIIYKDGKYYIYIEEFLYEKNKGHISLITMDEQGNYKKPAPIIEKSYHMSYPFVLEWKGGYYMVPETTQNKTIELYQCVRFPNVWEFKMNLMENISAVDATLLFHNDKWWLFTNVVENKGASSWDELFIFYSDTLFSDDWVPHLQNPVVSDVRKSRPAGKIFERNGSIYRPSQNCSKYYGYGFSLNKIISLSEVDYQEQPVTLVVPNWDKSIIATHSFSYNNKLTFIDGILRRRKR